MQYYDIQKNWKKVKPVLTSEHARRIIQFCMFDFYNQHPNRGGPSQLFNHGYLPMDSDGCDWRLDVRGRPPEYFKYVCHGKCHWLVDVNLYCANQVCPEENWSIYTSDKHSTVINESKTLLWDMNFKALKIDPDEAFDLATNEEYNSYDLMQGEYLMAHEMFEPILGGEYKITNQGRVWSSYLEDFMKLRETENGYMEIMLNGKHHLVHRLVAGAFLDNEKDLPIVHHKDAIKTNNWIQNLQWVTQKENRNESLKGRWILKGGKPVMVKNVFEFCEKNGYNRTSVTALLDGSHKDLQFCPDDKRPPN